MKRPAPGSLESYPIPLDAARPTVPRKPANGNGQCLPLVTELVSARAAEAPEAPALVFGSQILTYGQLEVQANQLAHYLRTLGVEPEVRVGLCLGRFPDMVIAALAILKAGGAYVPLDPDYPVERLRFMLADAQIPVLMTRHAIADRIGAGGWKVVDVEEDVLRNPKTPLAVQISGQNLAYVIYTSGSTGNPKGVQITHENLCNLISWHCGAFKTCSTDRASQVASVGFDAAVWEVWPNLAAGSSVHFPDEAIRVAPEPLRDWLIREQITVSFVPTPLAEALISLPWPSETKLRYLLTGGDTLHHYPRPNLPFVLVNNYGPTECTVVATSGPVLPNEHPAEPPPIGRPIDNFQIHILDEHLQQVPAGSIGELHIAGPGVGRGYLNRPDLGGEKFIPNPFASTPGERMYRTGDLGRYLADGQIAFVGRIDGQIKIRGYRIEPEEIVMRLDQCYGVEASLVVARSDNGDTRLIAYVVPTPDAKLTHNSLQQYLKKYLPDYMVPATFVRLAALPVASSGKVDRTSLPNPAPENIIGDQDRVGPSTPVEAQVVAILSELLGTEQVGMNDNFFLLGGHSLLGTQLIARARDYFGIELPLRTVFDLPTAAELSVEIERMLREERISAD